MGLTEDEEHFKVLKPSTSIDIDSENEIVMVQTVEIEFIHLDVDETLL